MSFAGFDVTKEYYINIRQHYYDAWKKIQKLSSFKY
jgi:hypothetical protein